MLTSYLKILYMIKLSFKRVDVIPSSLVAGTIYFEESTKLIKVAESNTEYTTYGNNGSISNVSFENNKLIITYKDTSTKTLDFSSVDSAQDLMPVFKELNTKIDAVNYKFGWYNSDKVEESITVEQLELLTYGVEWDSTIADPHLKRIGNPLLHKSLPIQSELKGCVVNGNALNYWLDPNDWSRKLDGTPSVLDGTDGTVRVHVPKFYGKSGTEGTKSWVRISTTKIDSSWTEIPEMYVDAYQCTVDTSDASKYKAVSVVNTSPAFRGGNNNSSYDTYLNSDSFRSNLGKQRTNLTRATMRNYAKNAGSELLCYEYYKWIFYWLYVIEYANFNCKEAYNSQLTEMGYHQGGLGVGVTNVNSTAWSNYNNYNPIIPCGFGNQLGNFTGIISSEPIALGTDGANISLKVPRWRGFDNPFGHIWTNLDGIIIQSTPDSNDTYHRHIYSTNDSTLFGDDESSKKSMNLIAEVPHITGWIKNLYIGSTGHFIPLVVGGNSSTYMCNYTWSGEENSSLRLHLVSGGAINGLAAGLGTFHSANGVGYADAHVGFRTLTKI